MSLQKIHGVAGVAFLTLLIGCAGIAPGGGRQPSDKHEATVRPNTAGSNLEVDSAGSPGNLVRRMSRALLRMDDGENWKPDTGLAHEIQRYKSELSALVEDANWVLALASALEQPLPEGVKKDLRRLHADYAAGAPHDSIAAQVIDLLPKVKEERLRKEMKKLANRSWDRAQRSAKIEIKAPAPSPPKPESDNHPVIPSAFSDSSLKETKDRVDSLSSRGYYLEALRVLETVEDQADADWIRDRRQNMGKRYCEDRRNAAALAFISARKTSSDSARVRYLRQSLSALDSCLFQFPDAPVAPKVRRNRALVNKELSK